MYTSAGTNINKPHQPERVTIGPQQLRHAPKRPEHQPQQQQQSVPEVHTRLVPTKQQQQQQQHVAKATEALHNPPQTSSHFNDHVQEHHPLNTEPLDIVRLDTSKDRGNTSVRQRRQSASARPIGASQQQQQRRRPISRNASRQRQQHFVPYAHQGALTRRNTGDCCMSFLWVLIQIVGALMIVVCAAIVITTPYIWTRLQNVFTPRIDDDDNNSVLTPPSDVLSIRTERHPTQSEMVRRNNTSVELVWQVLQSLRYHLLSSHGRPHPCLCMHHLQTPHDYRRICALYNGIYTDGPPPQHAPHAEQIYFMINPRPIGADKMPTSKVDMNQTSVSCPPNTPARTYTRLTTIFMEWEDARAHTHRALFRDAHAYCLQLATDEFLGNKHC